MSKRQCLPKVIDILPAWRFVVQTSRQQQYCLRSIGCPPRLQEVHTIQQPPRGLSSMRGFGWWRSSKPSSRHHRCLYVTTDCGCRRRQHAATCYLCVEPACGPFHHVPETKSSNRLTFTVTVQWRVLNLKAWLFRSDGLYYQGTMESYGQSGDQTRPHNIQINNW